MSSTLVARHAVLESLISARTGIEIWRVYLDGIEAEAIVYPELVGRLMSGDRVLLNTTAVELELGTGGQHIAISSAQAIGGPVPPPVVSRAGGHIVKLRYTPLQLRVLAVEEETSPHHDSMRTAVSLSGTPVICLGLHSQLLPAVGGIKAANPALRIGYLMTDGGALPLSYSRIVDDLRRNGWLSVTVTAGQAFGGDLEAVNVYSGLIAAATAGRADVIVAGQGPGNAGTATPLGFGGIEQAALLNAAAALEGHPIAVPRISFADPRPRHRGLSRQTAVVLGRLTLADVCLPVPLLPPALADVLLPQLRADGLERHQVLIREGLPGIEYCRQAGLPMQSMGRGYDDDPAFFLAAAAAGRVAAEWVAGDREGEGIL